MFLFTLRPLSRVPSLLRYNSTTPTSLKVLFFGSDSFSIASLKALHALSQSSNHIKQLDVVLRHPKHVGRGMHILKDLPLAPVAESLGLDIIRAETRKELEALIPHHYDMLIAVSYGKLIPSELIESVNYTLNVHPSLLPKYSGASPLQYALMNDDKTTGVTVQTLHPTEFDHGAIVAQTEEIPISENETIDTLTGKLGKVGAELLVDVVKTESFKAPKFKSKYDYSYAGKISKDQRIVKWEELTARQVIKLQSALGGPLITFKDVTFKKRRSPIQYEKRRVLISNIYKPEKDIKLAPGEFDYIDQELLVGCKDGIIGIGALQMQYEKKEEVRKFWSNLKKRIGDTPLNFVN